MISTETEVRTLGEAAREFEAAAEIASRAVARLDRVIEMAALKQEDSTAVALAALRGACEQARAAAGLFAKQVTSHAGVCDGVALVWSRRELDARARREPQCERISVVWGKPAEPVTVRVVRGELTSRS